jgi:hypothetical protein
VISAGCNRFITGARRKGLSGIALKIISHWRYARFNISPSF